MTISPQDINKLAQFAAIYQLNDSQINGLASTLSTTNPRFNHHLFKQHVITTRDSLQSDNPRRYQQGIERVNRGLGGKV